jgi:hypothetical protein
MYEAYAVWHELLLKFPKSERYTLGETCANRMLETIELILAAAAISDHRDKLISLHRASAKIDALKLLVRLAKDCKCISNAQYLDLTSRLLETGKMLGGWIKSFG